MLTLSHFSAKRKGAMRSMTLQKLRTNDILAGSGCGSVDTVISGTGVAIRDGGWRVRLRTSVPPSTRQRLRVGRVRRSDQVGRGRDRTRTGGKLRDDVMRARLTRPDVTLVHIRALGIAQQGLLQSMLPSLYRGFSSWFTSPVSKFSLI